MLRMVTCEPPCRTMKVKPQKLSKEEKIQTLDALYTATASLKGRESIKLFLRDLLTESERIMLGRRILIARYILQGETYRDIEANLRVGSTTITQVQKWLEDQMPGYEEAVKGLEQEYANRKRKRAEFGTFAHLKKRYPLHFLLFPWPEEYKVKASVRVSKKRK